VQVQRPRGRYRFVLPVHAPFRVWHRSLSLLGLRTRIGLILTLVVVVLMVLATSLRWQPAGRTVLEPPVPHASGVVWPLPSESSLAGAATDVPSSPGDSASVAGTPPLPPPLPQQQPAKNAPPRKSAPAAPAPPPFSALAGFRCPDTASSGYTQHVGSSGWYLVTGGGWTGNGCVGHMIAMPMSGDPNRDDLDNVVLWWFRMPPRPRCTVEVYVPGTQNVRDAAGDPATYFVYGTTDGSGSPIGQFRIDQVHNQGRWVGAGMFPAGSGQLSVRLMSRGGSDIPGARLGGSAARVSC
jgi:hypothetical protein